MGGGYRKMLGGCDHAQKFTIKTIKTIIKQKNRGGGRGGCVVLLFSQLGVFTPPRKGV